MLWTALNVVKNPWDIRVPIGLKSYRRYLTRGEGVYEVQDEDVLS